MTRRREPSDAGWEFVRPLLPESSRGRQRPDDRRALNGSVWMFRTETARRDVPAAPPERAQGPRDEASVSRQVRTSPRQCPVRSGPPARVAAYRRHRAPVRSLRASGASVPFVPTLPFREAPHDRTPPRRRIRRRARAP
ncbi:transposase [Streptomyces misionensis]|uniref:transposase n=1 Tax=Streptomyces misionensis TaxID=67331 RepID=UPI003404FA67